MKKLLIVDDEPSFVEVLKARLEFAGHVVQSAGSGEDALTMVAYDQFDFILLDVMMPNVDGYQFLQQLRANPRTRDIPVIVTTAVPKFRGEKRMESMGVLAYLEKPFDVALLLSLIEKTGS